MRSEDFAFGIEPSSRTKSAIRVSKDFPAAATGSRPELSAGALQAGESRSCPSPHASRVKAAATPCRRLGCFLKPGAVAALTTERGISEVGLPSDSVRESLFDFGRMGAGYAVLRPDHGFPTAFMVLANPALEIVGVVGEARQEIPARVASMIAWPWSIASFARSASNGRARCKTSHVSAFTQETSAGLGFSRKRS